MKNSPLIRFASRVRFPIVASFALALCASATCFATLVLWDWDVGGAISGSITTPSGKVDKKPGDTIDCKSTNKKDEDYWDEFCTSNTGTPTDTVNETWGVVTDIGSTIHSVSGCYTAGKLRPNPAGERKGRDRITLNLNDRPNDMDNWRSGTRDDNAAPQVYNNDIYVHFPMEVIQVNVDAVTIILHRSTHFESKKN